MTTIYAEADQGAGHPYANTDFGSLPQTPVGAPGQSVWTQLAREFTRQCRADSARAEYAEWRERHGWRADTPTALVDVLRDDPHGLGAIVSYYQAGSKLAAAILVEAFRPALITFTRYARLDHTEQIDRPEVRAQVVLVTFYEVASTTDPQSLSIAGRLYGETLKRVTRERPHAPEYAATGLFLYEHSTQTDKRVAGSSTYREDYRGRQSAGSRPASVDVAPVATRAQTDWAAIERKGLVRDVVLLARDEGVISQLECDLVCGRFLGDSLVPVPTLARSLGQSVSYCESKLRRALAKLSDRYTRDSRAAAVSVA
ncbi:hypothetical protein [Mycobacterium hubeiense]|uniref:hypothetical protein n=1 Tax=Mycobacterium hubeiense TaxID=1867256 RepID=UPI000C7F42F4|nr:hypothetical protein [Mycobacterium sp. QGD 101]